MKLQASFTAKKKHSTTSMLGDAFITGRRLRYFRKRANLSQFEVELEIGAASGSISRIENGVTNANKETLNAIADVLEMSLLEREYTYGKRMDPPSEEDVTKAVESVRELFNKPWVFGYLLDDRYRVWEISNAMRRFLRLNQDEVDKNKGRSLIEIVLDDNLGKKFLKRNSYFNILKDLLESFYTKCGFMVDDDVVSKTIYFLDTNDQVKELWPRVKSSRPLKLQDVKRRKVTFNTGLFSYPVYFSIVPLHLDERFNLVEYLIRKHD
ncbi:MAG: hypothetical protein KatS3mg085_102 [Candidatus Dojkabacteria bacterium]|nr:MAG: hypothetical protein KatS3mg085_102 [Candidatus Dojkabacteria bacterium]